MPTPIEITDDSLLVAEAEPTDRIPASRSGQPVVLTAAQIIENIQQNVVKLARAPIVTTNPSSPPEASRDLLAQINANSPLRRVFWVANGTQAENWTAVGFVPAVVTASPKGNVIPAFTGEQLIQISPTPERRIIWLATGATNNDWVAISGTTVLATSSPLNSLTPEFVGQQLLVTTTPEKFFIAKGATSADWVEVAGSSPGGGGGGSDPQFAQVILLASLAGANGSSTFTDESPLEGTLTPVGGIEISSAQSVLDYPGSLICGNDTSYVERPWADDLNLGSGDWTIEFWAYLPSFGGCQVLAFIDTDGGITPTAGWFIEILENEAVSLRFQAVLVDDEVLSEFFYGVAFWGEFNYYALVKSGTTLTIYVNGASAGTATISQGIKALPSGGNGLVIGRAPNRPGATPDTHIQEIRVTKVARTITSTPTQPFPRS